MSPLAMQKVLCDESSSWTWLAEAGRSRSGEGSLVCSDWEKEEVVWVGFCPLWQLAERAGLREGLWKHLLRVVMELWVGMGMA